MHLEYLSVFLIFLLGEPMYEGFGWAFAVMTPELLQSLADTFGRSITSAPSTPHFIIRADGSYTDLVTGIDAPDVLVQQIQAAQ